MSQPSLFYDTLNDAIDEDIKAAGGYKFVASKLWPSQDITSATTRLRNAVNPDQAQKLGPEELQVIKKLALAQGSFAILTFDQQDIGFRVEFISPADEAEQLRREIRDEMRNLNRRLDRLERAEARPSLKVAK